VVAWQVLQAATHAHAVPALAASLLGGQHRNHRELFSASMQGAGAKQRCAIAAIKSCAA
jgi:hypothetical protein